MSELTSEQKEYYLDIADKHANFLTEKVFKPAFLIAFIHGVKHGREDLSKELNTMTPEEVSEFLSETLKSKRLENGVV